jgi:hypothetical protein
MGARHEGSMHVPDMVEIWGCGFYVEAIEVNEAGEAISEYGARVLRLLRELDGGDAEQSFQTISLEPERRYVVYFQAAIH